MRAYLLFVIGVDGLAVRLPRDAQVIQLDPGTDSLFGWTAARSSAGGLLRSAWTTVPSYEPMDLVA
jgi:hypothetical protein